MLLVNTTPFVSSGHTYNSSGSWKVQLSFDEPHLGDARLLSPVEVRFVSRRIPSQNQFPVSGQLCWYYKLLELANAFSVYAWCHTIAI